MMGAMLPVTGETLRLTLHVLAATVWVGGQIALLSVVPAARSAGRETASALARRFGAVAWPAYGLLLATGIWNILDVDLDQATAAYQATFATKMTLVTVSGVGALVHSLVGAHVRGIDDERRVRRLQAVSGAFAGVGLLAGIAAVLLGVMLRG